METLESPHSADIKEPDGWTFRTSWVIVKKSNRASEKWCVEVDEVIEEASRPALLLLLRSTRPQKTRRRMFAGSDKFWYEVFADKSVATQPVSAELAKYLASKVPPETARATRKPKRRSLVPPIGREKRA